MSDALKLANSIWPNGMQVVDGYAEFTPLGTNKTNVPSSSAQWPKGNKLISPFVYQDDKLVGFCDTKAMEVGNSTTIVMPYEHIEAEFSSIDKGTIQIATPKATFKKASWKNSGMEVIPEAQYKYKGCKTVNDVRAIDSNYYVDDIVDGGWSEILVDLTNGNLMFYNCYNLTSFTSDLPSLTNSVGMFCMTNLTSFSSDLSSLINGNAMFQDSINLTTFNSDLSSLTNGEGMFYNCNLISFSSDLSSLTNGKNMFYNCKLDAPSVKNIIDTINTYSGELLLGMGCNDTTEDKDLFAQEVGYSDMISLLAALESKNWTVDAQYNGRPTTTYGLRRPSEDTLPVFVKLEETEDHADYVSEDGSKKFRLTWFHETTGSTDGYTQFNSLEEAIESLNIKPIEN